MSQRGGPICPWSLATPDAASLGWWLGAFLILLLYKHICAISIWFCSTSSKREMPLLVECDGAYAWNTAFPPSSLNFKSKKSSEREEGALALEPGIVHFRSMPSTS